MNKDNIRAQIEHEIPFFLSVPALVWQLLFFYIPTLLVIAVSFVKRTGLGFTLDHYAYFLDFSFIWIIVRSLGLALATSCMCLLVAYPVCYYLAVRVRRFQNVFLFFLILPFWTSLLVQVYSWFFVLDRYGLINTILQKLGFIQEPLPLLNNLFAVYVVMVYCYLPFMIMPLYAQLEKLNRRLLEASADLGATAWQTFWRVTVPLSLPGIKTGFFLVFVPSFGELVVPTLLGGGKHFFVGSLIAHYFLSAREPHSGAAFTVLSGLVLAGCVAIIYAYFAWLTRRRKGGGMKSGLRSYYHYVLPVLSIAAYAFLYLPIIILVIFSFNKSDIPFVWEGFSTRWYIELWYSTEIWQALKNSLIVATAAVTLSITMGLLYVFYGSYTVLQRLYLTFYVSLATPEIVLAVGLLSFFAFFSIPMGLITLIAGHTLIGLGYVIPLLQSRYEELDKQYLEASLDLGATEGQTLRWIMIPLLMPALSAAALLVFILSLDDFIVSFFCSGGSTQTLPMYIFVMIRSGATPVINALSTLLLLVSSLLVLIFSSLQIKKMDLLQ